MKKRNIFALSIFVIFYISFGVFLTLSQESIVYQPFPQDFDACLNFPEAQRVTFNGTRMYVHDTHKPTAVLYHGNAGSACDRVYFATLFAQAGYGYVVVEYAGYSNDARSPTHDLIKQDVKNIVEYLETENISPVTVVGESIGTGAASYHASLKAPGKLLLITPFTDLADIAKDRFWFYPTSLLVDNAFDNELNLQNYLGETLIIHGDTDSLIPYALGQTLFAGLPGEKTFITITGAGHNNLFFYPETSTAILEFLSKK